MQSSFHQMCRTCMSSGSALVSLYANQISVRTCTVAEMLRKFTTVVVAENDGLPGRVCLSCVSEINRAYFFKIKCENSEETLQQCLKELVPEVKEETEFLGNKIIQIDDDDKEDSERNQDVEDDDKYLSAQVAEILEDNDEEEDIDMEEEQHEVMEIREMDSDGDGIHESYELNHYFENSNSERESQKVIILACQDCCNTFESKQEFDDHASACTKEHSKSTKNSNKSKTLISKEPKKCPKCPMDFVHQKNLDKHIQKSHPLFLQLENKNTTDRDDPTETIGISNNCNDEDEESEDDDDDDEQGDENEATPTAEISPEEALLKHDPATLPSGKFTCIRCGAGFAKKKSLDCHMKINKCTEKQFICKICKRVFINDQNLIEHMKSHEKTLKCGKCSKTFSHQAKLQAHTEKSHYGIVKNQCKFCGKVFTMLSTLKDHLRTHSGEKPFLCSICGKGFSQNTNLKQHVMRHKNLKPYACDQCDLSFVSKGELNAHVRKHTGDHPFTCNMCGSSFTTSSSLVKHKRIHTGERPYACEFCPIRFAALGTLKNHRRTHTGEKPFKCEYCSRAFAQRSDCVTHLRSHTGERPYVCSICGWCFQQSGILKTHMKTHENGKVVEGKQQKVRVKKAVRGEQQVEDEVILGVVEVRV